MNEEQPTISAGLCIAGSNSFDPRQVTDAIGIKPTRIWRCKPEVAKQNPELDRVEWLYEIEDFPEIEYSKALQKIMDVFDEHLKSICKLAKQNDLTVGFHLVPRGEMRSFIPVFEVDIVQRLSKFNARLTVHSDRLR